MPSDDHGVAGADPYGASCARCILVSDDEFARLPRVYSVFRLIAQVGALANTALDRRDA